LVEVGLILSVGTLVRWKLIDDLYMGVVIKDVGVQTFSRKYLIYWFESGSIIKCYEQDVEEIIPQWGN